MYSNERLVNFSGKLICNLIKGPLIIEKVLNVIFNNSILILIYHILLERNNMNKSKQKKKRKNNYHNKNYIVILYFRINQDKIYKSFYI